MLLRIPYHTTDTTALLKTDAIPKLVVHHILSLASHRLAPRASTFVHVELATCPFAYTAHSFSRSLVNVYAVLSAEVVLVLLFLSLL